MSDTVHRIGQQEANNNDLLMLNSFDGNLKKLSRRTKSLSQEFIKRCDEVNARFDNPISPDTKTYVITIIEDYITHLEGDLHSGRIMQSNLQHGVDNVRFILSQNSEKFPNGVKSTTARALVHGFFQGVHASFYGDKNRFGDEDGVAFVPIEEFMRAMEDEIIWCIQQTFANVASLKNQGQTNIIAGQVGQKVRDNTGNE